jgi:hypothetical protein
MNPEIRNLKLQKAQLLQKLTDNCTNETLLQLGKLVFQIFVLEKQERHNHKKLFDED